MNNVFSFKKDFDLICNRLLKRDDLKSSERTFVAGVQKFGIKSGKISYKQQVILGKIYYKYVQRGEYKHHNWTIWN